MIMSKVVGNVGIRNMFYHTNFGGEGCEVTAKNDPPESSRLSYLVALLPLPLFFRFVVLV
jgi:hypothetical protein